MLSYVRPHLFADLHVYFLRLNFQFVSLTGVVMQALFFIRIEFIRILRLKFAKYYEILRINLRLKLRKEYNFAGGKSVNTIQWYVFTYVKLFLSLNGETNQQTNHSSLAIAKMFNDEQYMWCICVVQNMFNECERHELRKENIKTITRIFSA